MGDSSSADTNERISLRGRHDLLVYYLPASIPVWAALFLGLGFQALDWLIVLEVLPRGILLGFELFDDDDVKNPITVFPIVLLGLLGLMVFLSMFLPGVSAFTQETWERTSDGEFLPTMLGELWRMGVFIPLAIAAAARAWRAWYIDVKQDPSMEHVRHKTKERKTRRMFAFISLILWIVALTNGRIFASFGERFFATLSAAIYCFLPFIIEYGENFRTKHKDLFKPA